MFGKMHVARCLLHAVGRCMAGPKQRAMLMASSAYRAALFLLLALVMLPVQATDYSFPGPTLPSGCSGGDGNYICGALAFAAGDTLSVAQATTVKVNGTLSIGANALINSGGSGANLNFNTSGAVTVGAGATLNANVVSDAAVSVGANSRLDGNISTSTGAVSVGASTILTGSIGTVDGAVTLGERTGVSGSISTSNTGAISAGVSSSVGGSISSATGAIDIAAGSSVGGSISSSVNGAIGLGDTVSVAGGISSATGAITLGANNIVNGPITSTVQGAISLGASSQAGSTITGAGAVGIGAGSSVAGLISSTGPGAITIGDGAIINSVNCYPNHDQSCVANNSNQPMPPSSPPSSSGSAAAFDCLESGSNAFWSAAVRKPLYTKLVGASFSFDIAALNVDGNLVGNYAPSGGSARYVRVELFDDSTQPASCSAYAGAVSTQTVTFAPGVFSGAAGRTQSGNFTLATAYKVMRCRVTECVSSSCGSVTAVAPSCSSDQFSVRPQALTLQTSALARAPSPAATPVIKAGASFALNASASAGSMYAAPLTLDTRKLSAQTPSQNTTIQSGGVVGTLTPVVLTANAAPVIAVYTEVGYLYLAPGAFRDDTFSAIDSAVGDCISDTSSTAYLSDTLIGGKYGCSIGNLLPISFGRFIPDHFDTAINAGVPLPCPGALSCAPAGMIYATQPFGVTLTARSLSSATTLNYDGYFSHAVALQAWNASGSGIVQNPPASPAGSVLSGAAVPAASFRAGVAVLNGAASPAYRFPFAWPSAFSTLTAPTAIYVRALETGADGVTSARGSASVEGGVTVVSGRLYMNNNFGSEMLSMPIFFNAQYWNGTRFINSASDNASTFYASDIVLSNCRGGLNAGAGACIATLGVAAVPASVVLVSGAARFRLNAPGRGNTGSVDLGITSFPWLPSSTTRIRLGLDKGGPVLHFRESY